MTGALAKMYRLAGAPVTAPEYRLRLRLLFSRDNSGRAGSADSKTVRLLLFLLDTRYFHYKTFYSLFKVFCKPALLTDESPNRTHSIEIPIRNFSQSQKWAEKTNPKNFTKKSISYRGNNSIHEPG